LFLLARTGPGITLRTRIGMPGNLQVAGKILPTPGCLGISLEQKDGTQAQTLLAQLMEEALFSIT